MSRAGVLLVVLVVSLGASSLADEVYRWTDAEGTVHYSNVGGPPDDGSARDVQVEKVPDRIGRPVGDTWRDDAAAEQGDSEEPTPWAGLSDEEFSTLASQTRRDVKRQIEGKEARIAEIDSELETTRSAREEAMGGTGRLQGSPKAAFVESDEAEELRSEREKLEKEIADLRKGYEDLREEAVRRHGSLPGWWLPL